MNEHANPATLSAQADELEERMMHQLGERIATKSVLFGLADGKIEMQSSPAAIQGETGCTRGPPSSRSVAWYTIRPSIRSRAKAARPGSAFANSAQVATTDSAYRRAST